GLRAGGGGAGAPWALPAGLGPFFGAAAAGLVIGALLTLPTRTPWSPGQTLAPGLLLGGFGVLLAGGWLRPGRFDPDSTEGGFLAAAGQVAAGALGIGILLLVYPDRILDALMGFGLGALAAGLFLAGAARRGPESIEALEVAAAAEQAALAAVALATATYLATLHRAPSGLREWEPL